MRTLSHRAVLPFAIVLGAACSSKPAAPAPAPIPLGDSALAAIRWVDEHAATFSIADSVASADEHAKLVAIVGDARIIGLSELNEGTAEFTNVVRRMMFALADDDGVRGLAIQGPMAEAMEMDRYVRTGVGDPKKIARTLGSWRFETRNSMAMYAAMRAYNASRPPDRQIGFYGFEIPTASHAVQVITALRDSVTGPTLGPWLRNTYACVANDESAHWGLEGRAADSTFWQSCRPHVTAAAESISALRTRLGASSQAAAAVAFAEQMAKLVQHHVTIGLRHTTRHDGNAEHVLFLADLLGPNAKLMLWGGDVEMGRLTLLPSTIQTGVALDARLGQRYRAIGYMVGDGTLRTRRPNTRQNNFGGGGGEPGLSDVQLRAPSHDMYENILRRSSHDAYWLDARALPNDLAGGWLRGPRQARLISDAYVPELPDLTLTPVELPKFFDAVVFVKHVTPLKQ